MKYKIFYSNCPFRQYGSRTVWRLGYRVKDIIDLHGFGLAYRRNYTSGRVPQKSEVSNGALESRAGWKGLCRKGMILLYVLIAARLDMVLEVEYIRNAVCIGFIANEVTFYCGECRADGSSYASMIKKAVDILKGHSRKWSEVVWRIYRSYKICQRHRR